MERVKARVERSRSVAGPGKKRRIASPEMRLKAVKLCVEEGLPLRPSRIALPQRRDLVVLLACAWEKEYNAYSAEGRRRLMSDEAAHIVEEFLSPIAEALRR